MSERWLPFDAFRTKTNSKTFDYKSKSSWVSRLKELHALCWDKWQMAAEQFPLPAGEEEQIPGNVAQECIEQLSPIIKGLPPKTVY